MAIVFEKGTIKGNFPVFWRGECKVLPGDFKLKQTFPEGTLIRKGTPIALDFSKMECTVCKAVKIVSGGTTSAPRVVKGSLVQVGEELTIEENKQAITAIDSSNADYDVLTLAAALTGATTDAFAVVAGSEPNAVVETDYEYKTNMSFQTVSAGYDVIILKDVAYPMPDEWLLGGWCMKNNPSIKYVRQ